jgi:hypothetical protein
LTGRACVVSELSEVTRHVRVLVGEHRQETLADADAREACVAIARILGGREVVVREMTQHVGPSHIDERPDDAVATPRSDAREASHRRAAEETIEDRLGLIVEGVGHRDAPPFELGGEPEERTVARIAGGPLQGGSSVDLLDLLDIDAEPSEGQGQTFREGRDEGDLPVDPLPKPVVDHRDREKEAEGLG